jgi:hypothetical protein
MSEYYFKIQAISTNVRVYSPRQQLMTVCLRMLRYLAPQWTNRLILRLFFSPRRYPATAEEAARLARGEPFVWTVWISRWRPGKYRQPFKEGAIL